MKIALLKVFAEENWMSINIYSDRLQKELQKLSKNDEFIVVQPPAWRWLDVKMWMPYGRQASLRTLGMYSARWLHYPIWLRKVKADIYHILDNSYGHLSWFLPSQSTVVTTHGGTPCTMRHWHPQGPALWMFDLAFRGMLHAGTILSVSQVAKDEITDITNYPPEKIHVVHHGIGEEFSPVDKIIANNLRIRLLQNGEKFIILHVGHSGKRKNVEALYYTLATLRSQGYPVRLVRIGAPPTAAQMALIEELHISGYITHIQPLPNDQLPAYYCAADVFMFPSFYEGFGIPLIEAMACGVPVVCSDSILFHEVCDKAACYADPHDPQTFTEKIAQIFDQPTQIAQMKAAGLGRAKEFSWRNTAQQVMDVYQQIHRSSLTSETK